MTKSHLFTRFILKHFSTILTKGSNLSKDLILSVAGVFFLTFLAYYFTNPTLPKRFDHQIYLADSLLKGRVDLVHYPIKYHDVFNINGKKYTAFAFRSFDFLTEFPYLQVSFGGIQPSWRFVMDFLPFAALLSLSSMKKIPRQLTLFLILASLVFTSLGLYWAKISGW